jgi:hypothetical protein
MTDNLQNWLLAQHALPIDRTRQHAPERLEPGDVNEWGHLVHPDGAAYEKGRMWLTERQMRAAAYYGWLPGEYFSIDGRTGHTLVMAVRK